MSAPSKPKTTRGKTARMSMTPVFQDDVNIRLLQAPQHACSSSRQQPPAAAAAVRAGLNMVHEQQQHAQHYGADISRLVADSMQTDAMSFRISQQRDPLLWS
jgi:hypothetical protein